jgi:uncharacterized repeat protein (TIGR03803 family)
LAAALLVGCSGSPAPIIAPGAVPQVPTPATRADSTNFKVVHSFGGGSDGATPEAGLIDVGGTLYGTTVDGGPYFCTSGEYNGCGTVFSVTPRGTEKVLHDFGAGNDGRSPFAGLVDVGGTLYGTTADGGSAACYSSSSVSCGTVFSITPGGTEKVLHSFDLTDGGYPFAGLIDVKGSLYGTTSRGGENYCYSITNGPCGTVFSVTTGGTEKVLHSFNGRSDGEFPYAGLIDVKGTLYGTTEFGGKHRYGTVSSIATGDAYKVLHSFGAGSDGRNPYAGLIDVKGKLYGTTFWGGAHRCAPSGDKGCGTVFSITPGGKEKVIYSFGSGTDGAHPYAGLIDVKGTLYGTTVYRGAYSCNGSSYNGCGTVFSATPRGTEKVVHSFNGTDGADPYAALIDVKGTLYGTTEAGGAYNYGTVFSLKP